MGRRKKPALPARARVVQQRIEKWRRTREKRTRMPKELWSAAVELACAHGVWRIAHELGVRYESLKQRVVAAEAAAAKGQGHRRDSAEFVEVAPASGRPAIWVDGGGRQCSVELQEPGGATMTIRLTDSRVLDVAALTEAFWNRRR